MNNETAKDISGRNILVGDKVIFMGTKEGQSSLLFGTVTKITQKIVFVESSEGGRQITKENCLRMIFLL